MRLKEVSIYECHKLRLCYLLFVQEIPVLDLDRRSPYSDGANSPMDAKFSSRGTTPELSEHGSRRTSFSSAGRPSVSGRSGSVASSRSTSFSLPNESRTAVDRNEDTGEIEEGEPMDPEGKSNRLFLIISNLSSAEEKHKAFLQARGRHYSNEAEAMKVRTHSCLSWVLCRPRL